MWKSIGFWLILLVSLFFVYGICIIELMRKTKNNNENERKFEIISA